MAWGSPLRVICMRLTKISVSIEGVCLCGRPHFFQVVLPLRYSVYISSCVGFIIHPGMLLLSSSVFFHPPVNVLEHNAPTGSDLVPRFIYSWRRQLWRVIVRPRMLLSFAFSPPQVDVHTIFCINVYLQVKVTAFRFLSCPAMA